jgi:hypothetical protein
MFGLDNKENQLSCFLNTSLQAMWNLPMMRNYWRFQSEGVKDEKNLSMASLMKADDNVLKELKVRVFFNSNQSSLSSALSRIREWLLVKSQFMKPQL